MHCKRCHIEKVASEFYTSNKTRCKDCVKASVTAHRKENLERVRAYDKLRGSMPHRIAARKEYAKTPEGRIAHARALKVQRAKFPERAKARNRLSNAIRDGKVIPWPVCAVPGCAGEPEGHHPDYSRPLDVVWLCNKHHREAHAASQEMEIA